MTSDNKIKLISIAKMVFLILLVLGIPLFCYLHFPQLSELITSKTALDNLLEENKLAGAFIYIGLQLIQVVIGFIPGQIIQFAGGYAFGIFWAYVLSITGACVGTFISFTLAKVLGKDVVVMIVKEKNIRRFNNLMESKKAFVAIIIIYLLPGLPKDLFAYVAGISDVKMVPYVFTSIVARTPAMVASLIMGSLLHDDKYMAMVVLGAIVVAVLAACAIWRKRLYSVIDRMYCKFTGQ
ncbi:MAG: VTT domain-containing protein [Clostridiales Family XIII bacterium]|nr:VTT domain-containing protein [Clostridiales Family XIII bacterium]